MRCPRPLVPAALLVVLACVLAAGGAASAAERRAEGAQAAAEEVDHLALAALLVQDGHHDRARLELEQVDPAAEGLDLARYWTLSGLVALQLGQHQAAADALAKAAEAGNADPLLQVFLAQARFALEDFEGTLRALDAAGEAGAGIAGLVLVRAQSLWRLDRRPEAYAVLTGGVARFPELPEIARQRVLLLVDLGLYQEAAAAGRRFLDRPAATAEDFVAVAEALRQSRRYDEAARFLEGAHLAFPDSVDVVVLLGRTYLDAGRPAVAALLFEHASVAFPRLTVEAAELYRRAGRNDRALMLNAKVQDQVKKIRQRLGILIEMGRFEEAAAMEERLGRLGLLDEDGVLYALAYAGFQTRQYADAERMLKRVRDPEIFRKAADLRQAMEACRQAPETCP